MARRSYEYSAEQEGYIKANYLTITLKEIAEVIGSTADKISYYLNVNGLKISKEHRYAKTSAKRIGKTSLTISQQEFIKEKYLLIPVKTMANIIGAGETAVRKFMKNRSLIIPPEIIERNRKSAQIKAGNVPANKGKKQHEYMTPEQIARTAGTRFKKGNIPPNAFDKDGVIVIRHDGHKNRFNGRPYKYIRVALGKWREYHLYLWEKENGPLPKGHCLWFMDGDSLNVRLDNLELITRKENRLRNASWNTLTDKFVASTIAWRDKESQENLLEHPEIIDLKRKQILLNRAIKEHGRKQ
jgi:hypothetical protein